MNGLIAPKNDVHEADAKSLNRAEVTPAMRNLNYS